MKYTILVLAILLSACGGTEYNQGSDPLQDAADLCYGLGGTPQYLSVYNVDTGESYLDVECDFSEPTIEPEPEQCEVKLCKPGAQCSVECVK